MKIPARIAFVAGFASALFPVAAPAATMFSFRFDNQGYVSGDGPLIGPLVGTGTFTSPVDLVAGLYDLSDLPGFSLNFDFEDGASLGTADINTPLTGVAVRIVDVGPGIQRLFFTEGSGAGVNGGGAQGALDLYRDPDLLSFESSALGGNFLYFRASSFEFSNSGRYIAQSSLAPEPTSWMMMIAGFGLVGAFQRRRRLTVRFG